MPTDPDFPLFPRQWLPRAVAEIGMATILVDSSGWILEMNSVAASLTGWPQGEAVGQPLGQVLHFVHVSNRQPIRDPLEEALETGLAAGLSDHTLLIARDGKEWRIDHGAAAIRNRKGQIVGAVAVFCDISKRLRMVQALEDARIFAEGIVQTVREPLVILDAELKVRTANTAFYRTFEVDPVEIAQKSFFELGNQQWDIPGLRDLLEQILPRDSHFDGFEVEGDFAGLGRRSMILNARRLPSSARQPAQILLAIEDATERLRIAEAIAVSESRYRRLFETAQDGILLVDPTTRKIFDANPYLTALLGYRHDQLVGKELWEIGLFRDIESSKVAFQTLQDSGYIRYEDLPLKTHDERGIDVEFVSNVYDVGATKVIQCNIRDITDRKRAEDALRIVLAELEQRVETRTAELARTNESLKSEIQRRVVAETDRRDLQQQLTTVQEDERRRIARELHDQMGQHLTALGLGLKVVKDATEDPSPQRERLQGLQALTDQIGREIHYLALELRPTALDDLGLQSALVNYAEGWSERTGIEIDFLGTGLEDVRLPAPIETALYRVVQEALTNVLKHSAAKRVSVVLLRSDGQVSAAIEDDGRGFYADSQTANRLGILGMRERAALVGGTLAVESTPGQGTTVIARIPISNEEIRGRDG